MQPILTFNSPSEPSTADKLGGNGSPISTPSPTEQYERLSGSFQSLNQHFAENIALYDSADSLTPERVLVLEIAGSVTNFANAIRKVEGFELLAERLDSSPLDSEIFYEEKKNERKQVIKTAYLTMSSQKGLQKLLSIWKQYKASGSVLRGQAPLRDAFLQLHDIRFWSTRDRLESTHLLEDWAERLQYNEKVEEDELVSFEIELWFRESNSARAQAASQVQSVICRCGGKVESTYVEESIQYYGLLGQLPASQVREVINSQGEALELMRCDEVMFFRPLGQCASPVVFDESTNSPIEFVDQSDDALLGSDDTPVIALLDGLPLENHAALANRLLIDDEDCIEEAYESPKQQVHGTSMASLIIHGDLSDKNNEPALSRKLYVRPIMQPGQKQPNGVSLETIPSNSLPLDLIHRAVRRIKEDTDESPAAAKNVKVINLSIGDPYRLFDTQMSPWARMIDWLSFKYNILFVISAGNVTSDIVLRGVSESEFENLNDEDREQIILKAIGDQRSIRRMMSPAEAINAITVRASHKDEYDNALPHRHTDPYITEHMPSPINPISLGFGNSIKPEVMLPGGRQTYINRTHLPSDDVRLSISSSSQFGPGLKSASPGSNRGDINNYSFTAGTSNATAMATRRLAFLYETITSLRELGDSEALKFAPDAVILKALLVHGAEFPPESQGLITQLFKTEDNKKIFKSDLNHYLGFGLVNERRIHSCLENQATLIRTGIICDNQGIDYKLPLPSCLAGSSSYRRLIVTLAWNSPINPGHRDYRGVQLWVSSAAKQGLQIDSVDYYYHLLKKGTVFHEVRSGDKVSDFSDGENLIIRVNCKERAGFKGLEIPFALVVTIDTPRNDLPIYEQVEKSISIAAEQTA